ncbi:MAG: S9 family peptidase [Candidatus Fermentibacteraceae bacterium]|nr:S9 family peptidase [Candidatus Fermentibacteraceae bacterium]MBN2608035.1 S9 family peptidase [Candidatus Fermentibacteraceae bacterium]
MTAAGIIALVIVSMQPPAAERIPFEITAHGDTRVDCYYWLRDQEDPAVLEYLHAENGYTDSVMGQYAGLMDTLVAEMRARIPELDASVPYYRNGYWYWYEYREGEDYAVNMRAAHPGGEPQVLLDENVPASGKDYFMVEAMSVSPDNSVLAWAYDTTGGHWNTLVFQDIRTGDVLDTIHNCSGDLAWASDSRMVFYGLNDATGRTERIMRRTIGCDDEVCVFREDDLTFWPWVWNSVDMEWVIISTSSTLESECMVLPASSPRDTFLLVQPRTEGLEYYVEPMGDTFYILTNLQGDNYSIMAAPADAPGIEGWETVLPHSDSVLVERIDVFDDLLAVSVRSGGLKKLLILGRTDGSSYFASIGEEASTIYTTSNYDTSADSIRLWYSSMTTPWSTVAYDIGADSMRVLKMDFAGEDFDRTLYGTERLSVPARDGVMVPVSLVYRKDLFRPGENPLLLYGYGAYGSSMDPSFSSTRLSLLDRGFVYAIAHVRGGSEMGRWWYEEGRVLNKRNTFNDFIDCAEYLIEEGYCNPDRVFAMGESAGGLLMGAVVNMRPDLWRGVVAGVPFVDALTTMLDPSIPLTTNEYDEWGNPGESEEEYLYILSYSPVDNVEPVDYPALYVYTGLNDTQVGYWEPAKWVANIRFLDTGTDPVLLRVTGTGHGGASGRFGWLRDYAEQYAFLLGLL